MTTIFLKSTFEEPSETVRAAVLRGEVAITEQADLTAEILMSHKGLITGNQLDQNAMRRSRMRSRLFSITVGAGSSMAIWRVRWLMASVSIVRSSHQNDKISICRRSILIRSMTVST
ncbi:hypothetical protein [Martelella soudanensis]|uniref:hypothetical protein n=1 Tax=unclassified Martelella TaxID=2629616 RepID=UPI0015DD57C7|nr:MULTISPECIES: hypothetical protein [unclassified Martelella]